MGRWLADARPASTLAVVQRSEQRLACAVRPSQTAWRPPLPPPPSVSPPLSLPRTADRILDLEALLDLSALTDRLHAKSEYSFLSIAASRRGCRRRSNYMHRARLLAPCIVLAAAIGGSRRNLRGANQCRFSFFAVQRPLRTTKTLLIGVGLNNFPFRGIE